MAVHTLSIIPKHQHPIEFIRTLNAYDKIPESLKTGMEHYPSIPKEWVWVAVTNGEIIAALFTAPVYGIAFLLRLNAGPNVKPTTIRHLLGVALGQLKLRGFNGFFTLLEGQSLTGLKLARLLQKYGGTLLPFSGFLGVSKITRTLTE